MPYVAKDFGTLVGMDGFSETLLKNHFTLYQGYVTNTNKVSDLLGGMLAEGKTATPEYAELKRRFGRGRRGEPDSGAAGAMRGVGWVVLYQDKAGGRLFNQWVNEHDVGHPAGAVPLLVMDVVEHAFMVDSGLKRAAYMAAFFKNVN